MSAQGHLGYASNNADFKLLNQKLFYFIFKKLLRHATSEQEDEQG